MADPAEDRTASFRRDAETAAANIKREAEASASRVGGEFQRAKDQIAQPRPPAATSSPTTCAA